jgi:hypothetical protein
MNRPKPTKSAKTRSAKGSARKRARSARVADLTLRDKQLDRIVGGATRNKTIV